jgi:hypothetical protein
MPRSAHRLAGWRYRAGVGCRAAVGYRAAWRRGMPCLWDTLPPWDTVPPWDTCSDEVAIQIGGDVGWPSQPLIPAHGRRMLLHAYAAMRHVPCSMLLTHKHGRRPRLPMGWAPMLRQVYPWATPMRTQRCPDRRALRHACALWPNAHVGQRSPRFRCRLMRRVGHLRREPATRAHPPFSVKALAAEEATSPRRMARCTCPRASVGGSGECAHAPTVCAFGVGAVHKEDSAGFSLTASNFHSAASTDEANSATANLATAAMVETPCRRLASTIYDNARCKARVRKCTRCARSATEPCVGAAHGVSMTVQFGRPQPLSQATYAGKWRVEPM